MIKVTETDNQERKVLVVDDDKNIASLLVRALSGEYYVDSCHSAGDAIELLDNNSYGVVITDLNLGKDNGMAIAQYAKKQNNSIEVIIITGHASLETAREAIDIGVSSYLTKPIDIKELRTLVRQAFNYHTLNKRSDHFSTELGIDISEAKDHIKDLTLLFNFIKRINQSVNVEDTIKVFLNEFREFTGESSVLLGISTLGTKEIYVPQHTTSPTSVDNILDALVSHWHPVFDKAGISKEEVEDRAVAVSFVGEVDQFNMACGKDIAVNPITIFGETIGFIAYCDVGAINKKEKEWFFDIIAPLIAPAIYRGFLDRKTERLAQTDGLTAVANRRMMQTFLIREIQRAVRYSREISFIIMDIDNFKVVNDTYGHLVGDEILKQLAAVVSHVVRGTDLVARYGGEEFVAILPDTSLDGAALLAERVREALDIDFYKGEDVEVNYTVSVGVSTFPGMDYEHADYTSESQFWEDTAQSLISRADSALYRAKGSGKNCVVLESGV
jgi:two-component system cell cycle response regulator